MCDLPNGLDLPMVICHARSQMSLFKLLKIIVTAVLRMKPKIKCIYLVTCSTEAKGKSHGISVIYGMASEMIYNIIPAMIYGVTSGMVYGMKSGMVFGIISVMVFGVTSGMVFGMTSEMVITYIACHNKLYMACLPRR